jgi:uncharacterized protein YacL
MTPFFLSRIVGLVIFSIVGIRVGADLADFIQLGASESSFVFFWVGALFGLTATPWITVAPVQRLRRAINEMPVPKLMMSAVGGFIGLLLALLLSFPLSLLEEPVGEIAPAVFSVVFGYLGMTIFSIRANEIVETLSERFSGRARRTGSFANRQLLLDTSVLIDGRIVEISETGFIGGTLVIPRFVLSELHRVADSSDALRRARGRRGLAKLNDLQRGNDIPVKIIEDDPEDFSEVDAKLVALAIQLDASLVTNDFNLNQVADAQGVDVLNINALANAVRSVYIPGEKFANFGLSKKGVTPIKVLVTWMTAQWSWLNLDSGIWIGISKSR